MGGRRLSGPAERGPCAVCLRGLAPGRARHLPCGHCFHAACIGEWLRRSPTCPVCRRASTDPGARRMLYACWMANVMVGLWA